jgi:Retroviral aspartyl protease
MRAASVQVQSATSRRLANGVRRDRTQGWLQRDLGHHLPFLQQVWAPHSPVSRQGGRPRLRRRRSWMKGRYCGRRKLEASSGDSEFFKLLRGASEAQHPSSPSQLYLAIASIFSFSVCQIKEFLHPNQPYVNVQIGPAPAAALYDSGADISCLSENEFRKTLVDKRPSKIL